jgi:hypothetical protein
MKLRPRLPLAQAHLQANLQELRLQLVLQLKLQPCRGLWEQWVSLVLPCYEVVTWRECI